MDQPSHRLSMPFSDGERVNIALFRGWSCGGPGAAFQALLKIRGDRRADDGMTILVWMILVIWKIKALVEMTRAELAQRLQGIEHGDVILPPQIRNFLA